MDEKRFEKTVAIIIAFLTVAAALLAYLQSDASARDDTANRDTKRYATEAMGRKVSGDARVNYDYNVAYENWYELDVLANSAEGRDDAAAANRYRALRDRIPAFSPLMQAPYGDAASGDVKVSQYEADVYLRDVTVLTENYLAASKVKDAWDQKANTYIVHLTLLAVALFLFGLATTIAGPLTRWIFSGVGSGFAIVAIVWAAINWAQPVYDLRSAGSAIPDYAAGVSLAYQEQWQPAIQSYDKAIQAAPEYANAYTARAEAYASIEDYTKAIADYEKARALGDESASTAGLLAWYYYEQGRFDDAIAMNREALKATPDELWIQYDLGLSLLAAGKNEEALAAYGDGMKIAIQQVAAAKEAGGEPPSYLWAGLDDAAVSLQYLIDGIDSDTPPAYVQKIADKAAVRTVAEGMIRSVKSLSVGLEYHAAPPAGELAAKISDFTFYAPQYDENGEELEPLPGDEFPNGVNEVMVQFDAENLAPGQELIVKVYVDDVEDPSWRIVDQAPSDATTLEFPISVAYSDGFVLSPGMYQVDLYIDGHLAQSDWFTVAEE